MNFLNGIPQFAISIGYEEEEEIVCGVIFDPIKNEMFSAEKGNGAYLNNSRIRVSNKKKLKDSSVSNGWTKKNQARLKKKFIQNLLRYQIT